MNRTDEQLKKRWRLCHHLIFTPKYRKPLFVGDLAAELEKWIRRGAELKGVRIDALAIMPDHVHLMVSLPTGLSLADGVWMMKWLPSVQMRKRHPELKALRALWGKRYWARTVGGDNATVQRYINSNIPQESIDFSPTR